MRIEAGSVPSASRAGSADTGRPASAVGTSPTPPDRPLHVALVDDEAHVRLALRKMLASQAKEWRVEPYPDAEQALERIPEARPDVVLMDSRMPGIDGIECTRSLKKRLPALPIVMLSNYYDSGEVVLSIMAGASGYLLKPVYAAPLLDTLRSAARGLHVFCAEAQQQFTAHLRQGLTAGPFKALSARESEVMSLLIRRQTDKEIAKAMGLSEQTVHVHLVNIFRKLNVHGREQAVRRFLVGFAGPG